jgi:hypothetical protein
VPIGIAFWVIWLIAAVLGFWWYSWPSLIVMALLFLVGWKLFGFVVQG